MVDTEQRLTALLAELRSTSDGPWLHEASAYLDANEPGLALTVLAAGLFWLPELPISSATVVLDLAGAAGLDDDDWIKELRSWCDWRAAGAGGRPQATIDGLNRTALHYAALEGDGLAVKRLAKMGSAVDARDWRGLTPLHLGARRGSRPVCAALLQAGAEVDVAEALGYTPLYLAVLHASDGRPGAHRAVVRLLLDHGARADTGQSSRQTPIGLARLVGQRDLLTLLESYRYSGKQDRPATGTAGGHPDT